MSEAIEVHQVLHGYDGGHRLLASSIDLSPSTQRLLLVASDMSGPRMYKGFETYITGYPMKKSGYYALARTWEAEEFSRPGFKNWCFT